MNHESNQMNTKLKQVIALVVSGVVLVSIYYGSYLPLQKSQAFIDTLRNMDRMTSLEEVEASFSEVFAIPSPIGQEELVRHFNNIALQTAQQSGGSNPALTENLVAYVGANYEPFLTQGRGMSVSQDIFLFGALNQTAFLQTKKPEYLEKSINLFELGRELGPNRPQFLYQLFDVYQIANEREKAIEVGEKILSNWPEDSRVKARLAELQKTSA